MNPHRLTYGFAYSFPFALIAAVVSIPLAFTAKRKVNPFSAASILMLMLWLWMGVTSAFAVIPDEAWIQYKKVTKIFLMVLISGMLLVDKASIDKLIIVIAASFGYYGVKGGIFTILTGGAHRVYGPGGSFVEGNNEIALALLMVVPLFYYLMSQSAHQWLKLSLLACMALIIVAAIGSQSRGALLATMVMLIWLWFKAKNKAAIAIYAAFVVAGILALMPEAWYERMHSIQTYKSDGSAMGRINAWTVGWNIARDRLTGGGFEHWSKETFALYAPNPADVHDVHSIYFEVLGEHGFPGLLMYLGIWALVVKDTRRIIAEAEDNPGLQWAGGLARMIQVSLMAYAAGGAFLGLAYFDLPWDLLMVAIAVKMIVKKERNGFLPDVGLDAKEEMGKQAGVVAGFVRRKGAT
jgi:probable O-glycosylation ligase (exosortase A-associated)